MGRERSGAANHNPNLEWRRAIKGTEAQPSHFCSVWNLFEVQWRRARKAGIGYVVWEIALSLPFLRVRRDRRHPRHQRRRWRAMTDVWWSAKLILCYERQCCIRPFSELLLSKPPNMFSEVWRLSHNVTSLAAKHFFSFSYLIKIKQQFVCIMFIHVAECRCIRLV